MLGPVPERLIINRQRDSARGQNSKPRLETLKEKKSSPGKSAGPVNRFDLAPPLLCCGTALTLHECLVGNRFHLTGI